MANTSRYALALLISGVTVNNSITNNGFYEISAYSVSGNVFTGTV